MKEDSFSNVKAVLYARVSSREQEQNYSIEAQHKLVRDYATNKRINVVREFTDVETAKEAGRTNFGEMVKFLQSHTDVRHVLVEKTDRLYRNFHDYVALEDIDPVVHLVKENEILSKHSRSHAKFIHVVKVAMAKNYVDNLSEEVIKGMDQKASDGHWPTKAPIGYLRNTQTHQIEVDKDREPLILGLFEAYSTGNYSLKGLVQFASHIGLRTVKGNRINKAGIHRILTNLIYTGSFFYKGERFEGKHDPVVSLELFNAVQQRLRNGSSRDRVRHGNPFRKLVKCRRCGCAMTPDTKKWKYVYYRCTEYKGPCKNSISEQKLADLFCDVVRRIQIPPEAADAFVQALKESHSQKERFQREAIKNLQEQHRRLKARLEGAYDDKLDGAIDDKFWRMKSAKFNSELTEIEASLESHRKANHSYLQVGGQIIDLARHAYDLFMKRDNWERRRLLDVVLSECTFEDGNLYVTYSKPFNFFVEGSKTKRWRG